MAKLGEITINLRDYGFVKHWTETIKELLEDERTPEEIRVEYHRKFIIDSLDKE